MKLSISNLAWNNEQKDKVYQILYDIGFDGIEIAPTKIIPENPYDCINNAVIWKNKLKENYNLSISSLQSIWFGRNEKMFGNFEERNFLINYTKKTVDFASALECKNIVFGCPKNRNIKSDEDYKNAVEFFKILANYAFSKNTVISIEPNPSIYNTNFINDTKSAIDLIYNVNSDGFKLNLDIGTIIQNDENIEELIGKVELINHIHISEPYLELIKKREMHKKLINLLKNEYYDKYISIEMKEQENIYLIKETAEYLKEIIRL